MTGNAGCAPVELKCPGGQGNIKLPSFPMSKMSLRRHCFEADERKSSLSRRIGATKGKISMRAPKKWPLEGQSRAAHHDCRNNRGSLSAEQVPGDQNTLCFPSQCLKQGGNLCGAETNECCWLSAETQGAQSWCQALCWCIGTKRNKRKGVCKAVPWT